MEELKLELDLTQSAFTSSVSAEEFFSVPDARSEYNQLVSIFDYWNDLRGDHFAPKYADFEISDLDYKIIPNSAVVDVLQKDHDFVYRFWGTGYVEMSKLEMTGKSVRDLLPKKLSIAAYESYMEVMGRRVSTVSKIFLDQIYGIVASTMTLRLPMSSNHKDIDVIFSAVQVASGDRAKLQKIQEQRNLEK